MFDKMKELMEMKKQADRIKKELDATSVDVNTISGIKIQINGSQNFQSVEIDDSYFESGQKDKLQKDLINSLNAAIAQSQQLAAQKMKDIMPGMPGM